MFLEWDLPWKKTINMLTLDYNTYIRHLIGPQVFIWANRPDTNVLYQPFLPNIFVNLRWQLCDASDIRNNPQFPKKVHDKCYFFNWALKCIFNVILKKDPILWCMTLVPKLTPFNFSNIYFKIHRKDRENITVFRTSHLNQKQVLSST